MYEMAAAAFGSERREHTQTEFGGYDHRTGADDGSVWDCVNMSANSYPKLTTRRQRYTYAIVQQPNGICVGTSVCWVDGENLVVDGVTVAQVENSRKQIIQMQDKLVIFPDKVIYDLTAATLENMEASWNAEALICDGTYSSEPAAANTIRAEQAGFDTLFQPGDALTVTAAGQELTLIVREVTASELRFYENSFDGMTGEQAQSVTLTRSVPDLECVFEHQNRLWGWKGNEICASALGDPKNWNVFDGLSTDSWQLTVGSGGKFTGGCSYGGRPMFFKERSILKIFGDTPQEWQTSQSEALGVEQGSGGSLAVAGGTLFYKSPAGIMAYGGSYPRSAAEAFGGVRYKNAVAGSDGVKYYVSMEDDQGEWCVFVYDTRYGVWHQEDGAEMVGLGWNGELFALKNRLGSPGEIVVIGDVRNIPEDATREEGISTLVEFADHTDHTTHRKGPGRLTLRLEVDAGTDLNIQIQYDSDGVWHTLRRVSGQKRKGTAAIALRIRRCDHYRLRLEGNGLGGSGWTLHAVTWDRYAGSDIK